MEKSEKVDKLYNELVELLAKYENDKDISQNSIDWVNDTMDMVDIGFRKKSPDGDRQNELVDEKLSLTEEEAITELEVRIRNFKDGLGI